jgi:U4/U6.U5 tri-snRNP-associated protein 2
MDSGKRKNDDTLIGNDSSKRFKTKNPASSDEEFADLDDIIQLETINSKYTDSTLYLDTINKKILNFDMPLECCVTLATTNVHICLVCNKYLQGASTNSPAYMHAIDTNHHVFLNTKTNKFIILPEERILSKTREKELHDIQLLSNPEFNDRLISQFDFKPLYGETLNHEKYSVGYIPLVNDNIEVLKDGNSEEKNYLYYAIAHLSNVRDYLIKHENSDSTPLTNQLSNLVKKIWSPYLFKKFTSSYSIENYLTSCNLQPQMTSDIRLFYVWLINALIKENKILKHEFTGKLILAENKNKQVNFINLTVKLPEESIFKDGTSSSIKQYDLGKLIKEKKLQIIKPPKYLVIYIDRTKDFKVEGLKQQLNMNIVKFDPNLLQLESKFKYRLLSNITYDNSIQVLNKSNNSWIEFCGIQIKEIEKELLFISNCKLQFWELI